MKSCLLLTFNIEISKIDLQNSPERKLQTPLVTIKDTSCEVGESEFLY